ncbi:hypothetical protein LTR04_003761 [Oleoguttula sp. CCFEE 6159]|nr:hypothetical protein LTR04_003761 [Oleoguttula sp. CCFEE 6159]
MLDPIKMAARNRHKEPKPLSKHEDLTPFQRELEQNPYAQALAKPPRTCAVTTTRLPHFFYLDFYAIPHPETGKPWLMPATPSTRPPSSAQSPVARTLARRSMLKYLGAHLGTRRNNTRRATIPRAPQRLKGRPQPVWREDMDAFVLSLLQKDVMQKLHWPLHRNTRLISALPDVTPRAVEAGEQQEEPQYPDDDVACVIYFPPFTTPALDFISERLAAIEERTIGLADALFNGRRKAQIRIFGSEGVKNEPPLLPPPSVLSSVLYPPLYFPTILHNGTRMPAYSLTDLLGAEPTAELLAGTTWESAKGVVLRKSRLTTAKQMALLKLQGFVAEGRARVRTGAEGEEGGG